ncbi:MAG: Na/Pi cotransporter family protein [Verrucomicrobiales bacterium]|nr:Na/Pi cotransporter family protein [Verrucomicrobiales bacterium]
MKVLSDGIQKFAGDKMRQFMATMTSNRFSGVFTGFLSTSILQSSSATTVIVVSFVNAGLLTLVESIGVIMGANLGTTVTAWIIAAVGKFSLADWAMPIIGVGLPCLFVGKGRVKAFGEVCIGFGLLFFGLGLLKDAVPDVKGMLASDDPALVSQAQALQGFIEGISGRGYLSILAFLFGGILLTVVVQSSSAAMAITVTLAIKGWIGFDESCAIVLGENIGTTVTAYLASLGATTEAKRAARAHFIFNAIGTLWMLIVFYGFTHLVVQIAAALPESFQGGVDKFAADGEKGQIAWQLAIFHTLFNATNICLLVGFTPLIASVVRRWVKDKGVLEGHRLPQMTRLLSDSADLNLPEAEEAGKMMALGTLDMLSFVEKDIINGPSKALDKAMERLKSMEDDSDDMLIEVTQYLQRCSSKELSKKSAHTVGRLLRETNQLEEIGDAIFRAGALIKRRREAGVPLRADSETALGNLITHTKRVLEFGISHLLAEVGASELTQAQEFMEKSREMRKRIQQASLEGVYAGAELQREMLLNDVAAELEKVAIYSRNLVEIDTV